MKDVLRAAGYKATPGRLALLELLRQSDKPLGIHEITNGLRKLKKTAADQVTVYRILAVLEKIGLVRKVDLRHGHTDYELITTEDHHHIVCTNCGQLEDFKGCDLAPLARKALRNSKNFAQIKQHSLEFFGLCKKCAVKTANTN